MRRPLIATAVTLLCLLALVFQGCEEKGMDISHAVASRDDDACRTCHGSESTVGSLDAPNAERVQHDLVDHADRDDCTGCHAVRESWLPLDPKPAAAQLGDPMPIPHEAPRKSDSDCQSCHATGTWNAPLTPHDAFPDCVSCHE
ncbi:MAG: hypothetical protein QM784_21655 [Polyangiaceae bacterium]